ncbi:MAG: septum formation initiator family protein [Nitrospira sp.]|jgi:cell division protein FtsB|nr:septum formation initiator family protein [Nitrospira sp.]
MTRRNRSQIARQRRQRTTRQVLWVVGGVVGAVLAVSFFFSEMGLLKYLTMRDHAKQLEREIQAIERGNTELRTEIGRLQQDPARIEEVARERLGFVRKGETVYQVVEEQSK